jgi:4-diphosphocytidyl-2-C-methyl-D-erythritol kinase
MRENVFEAVIQLPEVEEIKRVLFDSGADTAMMSGSGPTVFGIFRDERQAKTAFDNLYPSYPKTFLTAPV